MPRHPFYFLVLFLLVAGLVGCTSEGESGTAQAQDLPTATVYKSPTCDCCQKWVGHLQASGFQVETEDQNNVQSTKEELGVPDSLSSCHTAVIGDYVVEGHVPASVIKRLLEEQPQEKGLAVPGMPIGSPGMEVPGRSPQRYEVIAFDSDSSRVYSRH